MKRRQFIKLVGGAAAAWPLAARAQQSSNKIPVVGVLWHAGSAEEEEVYLSVLVKAFNELGYVEGQNIHLDHRFPAENPERFRILARELVDAKLDAIIAVTPLGAVELKKLTSTIPIVFVLAGDPVGFGFVESGPARRQCHWTLADDPGCERKTLGTIQRSGAKLVACCGAHWRDGRV
jgi:putative ABC transport system substrate-binding protein